MYDRAPRILTRPTANTTPNVGPGTYYPAVRPHSGEFIAWVTEMMPVSVCTC